MGETAMKGRVQLRDVEADDLPLFFEHQRDPIAVALVGFRSRDRAAFDQHWEKLLANKTNLAKTIVADGQVVRPGSDRDRGRDLHPAGRQGVDDAGGVARNPEARPVGLCDDPGRAARDGGPTSRCGARATRTLDPAGSRR